MSLERFKRLQTGQAYSVAGGELVVSTTRSNRWAKPTKSSMFLDGTQVQLVTYNIEGSNYFKLRDIAALIDFNVTWDGSANTVGIDTEAGYEE